ncbi:hypothetical protein Hanom_Chr11g01052871 [Helianthus anomalus]
MCGRPAMEKGKDSGSKCEEGGGEGFDVVDFFVQKVDKFVLSIRAFTSAS